MTERRWVLTAKLRAVNYISDGSPTWTIQQCWWDVDSGAEEWRDIPVYNSYGGVVWEDMSAKTGV